MGGWIKYGKELRHFSTFDFVTVSFWKMTNVYQRAKRIILNFRIKTEYFHNLSSILIIKYSAAGGGDLYYHYIITNLIQSANNFFR